MNSVEILKMSDDSDETQEFHSLKLKHNTIKGTEQDVHISDSQSLSVETNRLNEKHNFRCFPFA